jgi:hypothetical protein
VPPPAVAHVIVLPSHLKHPKSQFELWYVAAFGSSSLDERGVHAQFPGPLLTHWYVAGALGGGQLYSLQYVPILPLGTGEHVCVAGPSPVHAVHEPEHLSIGATSPVAAFTHPPAPSHVNVAAALTHLAVQSASFTHHGFFPGSGPDRHVVVTASQ